MDTSIVILAGGFGTRVQHLLGNLPKPMVPVAGRPFLEWVVRYFTKQGIRRFVLSVGYQAETIERHFSSQPVPGVEVICISESEPQGTAGGFLTAVSGSKFASRIWLVANGDSLALGGIGDLVSAVQLGNNYGAILGLSVPDTSRFGSLETTTGGALLSFAEKRPGAGVINAGVYAFRSELLTAFPEKLPLSFETEVFPALLEMGHGLNVVSCQAPFLDIGTEATLSQAEKFIIDHEYWF